VDGQAHLVAHLEEAARRLCVMQDEHGALSSTATWACGLALGGNQVCPLAVALPRPRS
jgi:hypothetical protein